ncbi:MAG: prolyl oligopeptidase family serine peptidase [Tenuifilaceae bacterium]|jgi:dipeptidyl aminopeptidase/acylaminoacyl peptidase|nr:prolyl oligopeptidase family serine peptidase [Tenuifilaceae bacterium]
MKQFQTIVAMLLFASFSGIGQDAKVPLTHSVYDDWKNLDKPIISADGKWVTYQINPQDGDGTLWLENIEQGTQTSFERGSQASISANSNFLVFEVKPSKADIRKAKLAKKKRDDMPKDSLAVYVFNDGKTYGYPKVKSYKIGDLQGDWIAILISKPEEKKTESDTTKTTEEKKKPSSKKASASKKKNGNQSSLVILNPITGEVFTYNDVSDYTISRNGKLVLYTTETQDSLEHAVVNVFNTQTKSSTIALQQKGNVNKLVVDEKGENAAFLFTADTGKVKIYDLYTINPKNYTAEKIITANTKGIPTNWVVSSYNSPFYSKKTDKLYFFTMPRPVEEPKDTLTDDEKAVFDLWSYTDTLLQTQQKVMLKRLQNQSYLAVYHFKDKSVIQLANKKMDEVRLVNNGDALYALGVDETPYMYAMTWDYPSVSDYYIVNIKTGEKKLAIKGGRYVSLSPEANHLAFYEPADSSWYSYTVKDGKTQCLTCTLQGSNFFDVLNDVPSEPYPYGMAGWLENGTQFLAYEQHDIWLLDATGKNAPKRITAGKEKNITYRIERTDSEALFISSKEPLLLNTFNRVTKNAGFAQLNPNLKSLPIQLAEGSYIYRFEAKARNAEQIIFTRQSFTEYGDLWYSKQDFATPTKLSNTNPQMDKYLWGSVELVSWVDFNRDTIQGLLYKPENFDSSKKYPMMVYFYERHTDDLNRHYVPVPGRSVICPTFYTSNDYLVFMPDIKYTEGLPGRSAYDAIISGTMAMVNLGFADVQRIGVQGQSWGGYQIAYLVTQTDLFKAASAGAPVSNMTSAYGGIRWGSGLSRMFQYERTQSRIGASLWERPLHYIENSPLFFAPRVNTPMLIRHDDADEAVPWYQGIEYFLALRRLNKQVWMVNYNDDAHNLVRRANRVDWTIRMQQFFDYYLKDAPMPEWMDKGIPATQKGKTLGYDPVN